MLFQPFSLGIETSIHSWKITISFIQLIKQKTLPSVGAFPICVNRPALIVKLNKTTTNHSEWTDNKDGFSKSRKSISNSQEKCRSSTQKRTGEEEKSTSISWKEIKQKCNIVSFNSVNGEKNKANLYQNFCTPIILTFYYQGNQLSSTRSSSSSIFLSIVSEHIWCINP